MNVIYKNAFQWYDGAAAKSDRIAVIDDSKLTDVSEYYDQEITWRSLDRNQAKYKMELFDFYNTKSAD